MIKADTPIVIQSVNISLQEVLLNSKTIIREWEPNTAYSEGSSVLYKTDPKRPFRTFVAKQQISPSSVFDEGQWTLMDMSLGELMCVRDTSVIQPKTDEEPERQSINLLMGVDQEYLDIDTGTFCYIRGNPNFNRGAYPFRANEVLTEAKRGRVRELFSQTVRDENRLAFSIPTVVRYHPTEWVEAKSAKYDGGYASSIVFEQAAVATKIEYQAFIDGLPVRVGTLRVLAGPGAITYKDSWSLDFDQPEIEFTIQRESDQFVLLAKLQSDKKLTLMVRRANIAPPPERVAPNLPPVWVTGTDLGLVSGSRMLVANDPEGYPVTYTGQNLPVGVTLNQNTGELNPNGAAAGNYTIIVDASDGIRATRREFTMRVNNAPVWQTPAGSLGTFTTGAPMSFQLAATDADGDALTYSVVGGALPAGATMTSGGLLSGSPTGDGSFTVRVTDGTTPVNRSFTFAANAAPIWSTPAGSIGQYTTGSNVSFQFVATDPDNDALVYSVVTPLPSGLSLSPGGLLTGTSGSEGSFTLRVADPSGASEDRTFSISSNSGPVWVTGANAVGPFAVGSNPSYQLVATDADNDPLTYTLVSGAPPRNMSVSSTALLSGGPIMPVTPEQLEFPISANTLIEVYINDVQTTNFTVNGQPYNPPVSAGSNWTFIDSLNATAPGTPADSSYLATYGSETYFKSKPLEAPFITDGATFVPVPGQTYTVTYTLRKVVKETNGVVSCFRPAFDATRTSDSVQESAMGVKYGFGYDSTLDFIITTDWTLNQFYTMSATWTAPSTPYSSARGRLRVNRTPFAENSMNPPTFSNAVFEIASSEVSAGAQRPKSTVFVPAPSSNAVVRVVTRAISNPAAIVDSLTHNHFPVTSETNTFSMRVRDPSNLFADRTFTVNTYSPDKPAGQAYVVNTTAEYDAATAPNNAPPSQEDIFNSWPRFDGQNYYPTGTPPGGQATGWTYSDGTIKSTVNSGNLIGFVSPDTKSSYTHAVTLSSTNADDDAIAVIIAFALVGGVPYSLLAWRSQGGLGPTWALVEMQGTSRTVLTDGSATAPMIAGGWGGAGNSPSRIEIVRNGNSVSAKCSQFGSSALDNTTTLTYQIPAGSAFEGTTPYGYAAQSQADATFSNIAMTGGLDATVVYDARTATPKVMVYNFTTHTWEQDLSRSIFRDQGYPRNITNPATGKTFRLTGPRPYSVTNLP